MRRFLAPREHGAYAQLTFPILSGLILGRPGLAAVALAAAVVSGFLAYEPLAVLRGVRGVRLQREAGRSARRQLAVLVPLAVVLGGTSLACLEPAARLLALLPAGIAAALLPLALFGRLKSLAGETLVAAALATVHLPLAAAGGVSGVALWGPAAVWFAGFFLATLAVHAIKARQKQRETWVSTAATLGPPFALVLALAAAVALPALRTLALVLAVPLLAVVAVNVARVHPRALKRVGWTLVAADAATLALLTLL